MTSKTPVFDFSILSFEDALKQLEDIVRALETGQTKLDESIASYEKGMALKKHLEEKLSAAKMRVEQISLSKEGKIETKPFDVKDA